MGLDRSLDLRLLLQYIVYVQLFVILKEEDKMEKPQKSGFMAWLSSVYSGTTSSGTIEIEPILDSMDDQEEEKLKQLFESMISVQPEVPPSEQ